MPILDENAEVFQDLFPRLPSTFGAQLSALIPSTRMTFEPLEADLQLQAWQALNGEIFGESVQRIFGGSLVSTGMPLGPMFWSSMNLVGSNRPVDTLLQTFQTVLSLPEIERIVRQVVEEVLQAIVDVIGVIPLYGWVVEAIWKIGSAIRTLVEFNRKARRKPETIYERGTYDPNIDWTYLNIIKTKVLNKEDLTWIFKPYGIISTFDSWKKLDEYGGTLMTPEIPQGFGFCPWNGRVHHGVEIESYGVIRDRGTFRMASGSAARLVSTISSIGTASATASADTPLLFMLDAKQLADDWRAALFTLRHAIRDTNKIDDKQKRELVTWLSESGPQFEWGPYDMPFDPNLPSGDLYANFGIDDPNGILGPPRVSQPVRWYRNIYDRQRMLLNRLTLAYVNSDFPAIAGSSELRQLWTDNFLLLLNHEARCSVDLENVPNISRKLALESAIEKCTVGQVLPVSIEPPLPPLPPWPSMPFGRRVARPRPPEKTLGQTLLPLGIVAGGLVGGAYLARKYF